MNGAADKNRVRASLPRARRHHYVAAVRIRETFPIRTHAAPTIGGASKNLWSDELVAHADEIPRHEIIVVVGPKTAGEADRGHDSDTAL